MLLVCVLACGHAVTPAASPVSVILAGPTVPADSLRVAATDSFGVGLARQLARDTNVHVAVVSDRGALDFIDRGGDVLVTDRPSVIRYASSRADFATVTLPWDREYVLVAGLSPPIDNVVDAVHADARPAWLRCHVDSFARGPRFIVGYVANDSIARSLAERLLGLGIAQSTVAIPERMADRPNAQVMAVIKSRPIDNATCEAVEANIDPLVDTRSHLIVRRDAVGVVADTTGSMRLETTP
jgi:hypothetical protein